jgi:uncharacterized protein YabN with tetrapyrrole methylase and pyrophosphatase domain
MTVEQLALDMGRELSEMTSPEMEALWVKAKSYGYL